jgi:hypothetical protein
VDDQAWCDAVTDIYERWLSTADYGREWKVQACWDITQIREHKMIASLDPYDNPLLGVILEVGK